MWNALHELCAGTTYTCICIVMQSARESNRKEARNRGRQRGRMANAIQKKYPNHYMAHFYLLIDMLFCIDLVPSVPENVIVQILYICVCVCILIHVVRA